MDKDALKRRMLELEQEELTHALDKYADFVADARLDQTQTRESDEVYREAFAGFMAEAFDQPVQTHNEKIEVLRDIDFSPRDTIGEGAVVRLGDRWFVIAVSTAAFDFEGMTYMGLSTAAPIYDGMDGMKAGDTITFRGRDIQIAEVL